MDVTYNFEDSRAQDSKSSMSIANSPVSQKNEMNEDEEEKEMNSNDNNDLLTICSEKLLNELKLAQSEDYAIGRIQEWMKEYTLKNNAQINSQASISKHKYTVKEKRIVSDAIKKLLSDNVMLKSAIRKLVDKNEKNRAKVEKYDELEQEYMRLWQENEKLHNSIDILKYAVKDTSNKNNNIFIKILMLTINEYMNITKLIINALTPHITEIASEETMVEQEYSNWCTS